MSDHWKSQTAIVERFDLTLEGVGRAPDVLAGIPAARAVSDQRCSLRCVFPSSRKDDGTAVGELDLRMPVDGVLRNRSFSVDLERIELIPDSEKEDAADDEEPRIGDLPTS